MKEGSDMNEELFNAAIVEDDVITNVLVFNSVDTMKKFGALPLADGQGIGDIYMTPEAYKEQLDKERFKQMTQTAINQI